MKPPESTNINDLDKRVVVNETKIDSLILAVEKIADTTDKTHEKISSMPRNVILILTGILSLLSWKSYDMNKSAIHKAEEAQRSSLEALKSNYETQKDVAILKSMFLLKEEKVKALELHLSKLQERINELKSTRDGRSANRTSESKETKGTSSHDGSRLPNSSSFDLYYEPRNNKKDKVVICLS